jgi:hypothetical protein
MLLNQEEDGVSEKERWTGEKSMSNPSLYITWIGIGCLGIEPPEVLDVPGVVDGAPFEVLEPIGAKT